MNAQDLKNSILQLAVQGKLVEQRAEEGTARELLEQIKLEKDQLIKDKKIKKSKPLLEITEDEIPFEIPESWEWVRLGDISSYAQTKKKIRPNDIQNDMWSLDLEDIEKDTGAILNKVCASERKISGDKVIFEKGNILYSKLRPYLLKILVAPDDGICTPELVPFDTYGEIYNRYIMWVLKAPHINFAVNAVSYGVKMPRVGTETMVNLLVPLPPLEEQHRIVAKIEEILPYIDQYDKAYTKLEAFNKKFPEDMKKSILQMAMQGKLVEQRPEEGTADGLYEQIVAEKAQLIKDGKIKKEKPLPEIAEDEIPFEIPSSWKWVKLNDLCEKIGSGSTPSGGRNIYKEEGIKFLRSQNVYNDGIRYEGIVYISEELNKKGSIVKAKDILLNITGGSIGRCVVVPDDFDIANINQHVMIIRGVNLDIRFWIHNIIISPYIQSKIMDVQVGVSREGLSAEKLKNFLIPLPPLEEQKRIVAKIEELLPYCDQLIK
ncbi:MULTISPECIES: restriction endonuclease subunit S [Clostridia]|uniref:restriction endonuclease subunit S n=1 Tax=Clostridia TaxID=186801 RepID=UPI000E5D83D9|nr:restriction endonuclease subunit S [Eubacterium sp. AF22-9]RGS34018.1 restriction endonuclease subunit S [Eubacterium sp. AF22-9]